MSLLFVVRISLLKYCSLYDVFSIKINVTADDRFTILPWRRSWQISQWGPTRNTARGLRSSKCYWWLSASPDKDDTGSGLKCHSSCMARMLWVFFLRGAWFLAWGAGWSQIGSGESNWYRVAVDISGMSILRILERNADCSTQSHLKMQLCVQLSKWGFFVYSLRHSKIQPGALK